jgi:copper chaperone CopZ
MTNSPRTVTYALTGLHCRACVKKVGAALQALASHVEVSLNPMQATLIDTTASFETVRQMIENIGYGVSPNEHPALVKHSEPSKINFLSVYRPLLLIVAYLMAGSFFIQIGVAGPHAVSAMETMRYFMAGFFLVFSFFKLLDIQAFATAYARYDLLAMRWPNWGLIYPFLELALGVAYLTNFNPLITYWLTIGIMGFSAIGVIQAVASKTQIQCACLGIVFKLPMSTVTIIEDVGMVVMAATMLVFI